MSIQYSASYDLGQHTLEVAEETGTITIGNETLAVQLERKEAYHLHFVLADLFCCSDAPANTEVARAPD